ncbi:MAG: hypothetical protein PHT60_01565 [Acidiphilium sp.]|nr:hypothetical protein [Acidiphilium sp.]MDD4934443.1 hypothetical protein [Acidiphilium sp.]
MKALLKTLFGTATALAWVAGVILLANRTLASPARPFTGIIVPGALLIGAALLARR